LCLGRFGDALRTVESRLKLAVKPSSVADESQSAMMDAAATEYGSVVAEEQGSQVRQNGVDNRALRVDSTLEDQHDPNCAPVWSFSLRLTGLPWRHRAMLYSVKQLRPEIPRHESHCTGHPWTPIHS
jgi:hypothetical protein